MGFYYRIYTGLGKQTLGGHKQNLVCTRTQEKGALTPHETEPDLPVRARDGNTRPADPPPEKSVCRSGINSQNWSWNNRLIPNRKRSMSRLYIVTLLI